MKKTKCRHCKNEAVSSDFKGKKNNLNLLFQCQNHKCKKFFWHGRVKGEFNLKEKPNSESNILIEKNLREAMEAEATETEATEAEAMGAAVKKQNG